METFYGIGTPTSWSETLKPKSDTAIIGFAGAYAGGSNTAQYERMLENQFGSDNILAFPSVTSKYAFKEPVLSKTSFKTNDYYRVLARQAVDRFPSKDTFLIHCHSGGGIEGLAFIRALLEKNTFPAKNIKLLFTGVPGFAEKQSSVVGRTFEFFKRLIDSNINRAQYQHFDLCPPPEEYFIYENSLRQPHSPDQILSGDVVYHDTPSARKNRREKFYTQYMSFLPEAEKVKIAKQIKGLDTSIKSTLKAQDSNTQRYIKELMHQQAKLVYSIGGDRYYNEYLANKPEYKNVPNPGFDGTVVGALYLLRLFTSIAHGMEIQLAETLHLAEKNKRK